MSETTVDHDNTSKGHSISLKEPPNQDTKTEDERKSTNQNTRSVLPKTDKPYVLYTVGTFWRYRTEAKLTRLCNGF